MNRESITKPSRAIGALALLILAGALTSRAAAEWTVVATGLHNPRGLDFAPNGALYIAESGSGGNGPVIPGAEFPMHFGTSGSITRVFKGTQERIVTGLPSFASETGASATGPSAVSFGPLGHAFVTIGLGRPPHYRDDVIAQGAPAATNLGRLFQMNQNGQLKEVADLAGFEARANPDGNVPDSNPNGVLASTEGAAYVADAGGNDLLRVDADGTISVVAVFPNRTVPKPPFLPTPPFPSQLSMQSVSTNVVRGPDGALYVSELTGFPFPVGAARVYRVVPGSAPTIYAEGFTNIIDLEFDAHGNLYVLEIDANSLLAPSPAGRLARINAGGGAPQTIASDGLVMPGGMAIGPDGAIYVSNYGTSPTAGEVVRIEP
jgi:glucose/arabinose dehydrogenase